MTDAREKVLAHAADLKGSSLDVIECGWIDNLCISIFGIFERLYNTQDAEILANEACIVALTHLVRGNRFPTSFSVLRWNDVASLQFPVKCDYENPWESSILPTPPKYVRIAVIFAPVPKFICF